MNEKRNLRKLAEKKLSKKDLDYSDKEDMKDILHELQVHQLELEQQNQEMKKIQEELVKMRDKYHLLFEMAPIAYFNFNNKGVILNSNLKAARMLKVEKKHLIYKPFIIYLPSSSQEQFYQHLKTVVEDKSYKRSELELKNKKGEIREVLLESNYIVDEDYIHSAVIDITERKNMEKKLIESQHYNESIVKAIPDIIIRIDTSGIFEDVITGK
ncbi:MAG: PAS domain-containing protein, partial [Halanaerobiales bacterium]